MVWLTSHLSLPLSPLPLSYVFNANRTLKGWMRAFLRSNSSFSRLHTRAAWEERGLRRLMADIFPRFLIIAVIGMFSSSAAHTCRRGHKSHRATELQSHKCSYSHTSMTLGCIFIPNTTRVLSLEEIPCMPWVTFSALTYFLAQACRVKTVNVLVGACGW